jgi:two-component system response regulator GlrR
MAIPPIEVLVADDDPSIRAVVTGALEDEGYRVEAVTSGNQALRVLQTVQPRVLLLDMQMPGGDGWLVARALHARGLHIPIVVMTASPNARAWARELHAAACLAKPFDIVDLLTVVERFCPDH